MSDPSSRLNLIARAMQRGALAREEARPPQASEPERVVISAEPERVVISAEPADADRERDPIPATAAPSIQGEVVEPLKLRKGQPVRLHAAKLIESRIGSPENVHSVTYNEFRALKRKLIPMTVDPDTGVMGRNLVMVTSALPGEGKTFTAMNLAIALAAEPNVNVILVDGDSVRKSIATFFHPPDGDGLLELLTGTRQRLDEVLHTCVDMPRLHVLFSGARHDATPELLASHSMEKLCATLSAYFPQSIVLFDTPPVLAASEAAALAAHVNHVLMVVAAGRSERNQVEAALSEVSRCSSTGIVFNRSPQWERPLNYMYSHPYAYAPEQTERA